MNDFDYNWRRTFGWPKYCVTHPPYTWTIYKGDTMHYFPNLEANCGCGKPYKDHPQWKQEYERILDFERATHELVCHQTKTGVSFTWEPFDKEWKRDKKPNKFVTKIKSFLDSF